MSDQELWQQLRSGQKAALEKIYRQHADVLLRYGYKFSSDTQLVEDCLQELFVELWKNRQGLGQNDSIRRYLFVAIRRKIIRESGRRNRMQASSEAPDHQFEIEFAVEADIIDQERKQERSQQLKAALDELSPREKEAIYLKYQVGMEYKDICEVMGINYQSVRNLVARGLKNLKKLMTKAQVVLWIGVFMYIY